MKKIFIPILLMIPFILKAQGSIFYFHGKDIKHNTFKIKADDSIEIKASFINNTQFAFNITSVLVLLRVPKVAGGPVQQKYSGIVNSERKIVFNPSKTFSKKPSFNFKIRSLLDKYDYGCEDCEIVFKINELSSDSDEGNSWIDRHLLFEEVPFKKSIVNNEDMRLKGD